VQALFGTSRSSALQVVEAAINNAEIRVMDATADDTLVYNAPASEESNAKVAAIRELFSGSPDTGAEGWIWQDATRTARLEALYNAKFNRLAPTRFDGAHQAMPGIVRYVTSWTGGIEPFRFHAHQLNAIWRIVSSGNTLIDHAVGAGKTFTMIAAGMEQKRLGLIQRPMYVIPNHMLDQFSREFMQLYPGAKILIADKESMSRAKRREFAARIAAERWDGIVITHDAFGRIRMSDAAYQRFIRRELDELADFKARAAQEEGKDSPTVKELEKARKRLETRLDKVLNKDAKDEGVTFEELAVDFLFVD
jgi:N12 class adenine-specific DNA methylase